jgi:DNA-directed RNA polymerase subunit K/omega
MYQQYMPIEKVLQIIGNRYIALNLAAQDARRVIEGINKGEIQIQGSPYYQSLRRLFDGEVQFEDTSAAKTDADAGAATEEKK